MHEVSVRVRDTQAYRGCFKRILFNIDLHLRYNTNLDKFLVHFFDIVVLDLVCRCGLLKELADSKVFLAGLNDFFLSLRLHDILIFVKIPDLLPQLFLLEWRH